MAEHEMNPEQDAQTPPTPPTDASTEPPGEGGDSAVDAGADAQEPRDSVTTDSLEAMAGEALDDADRAARSINEQAQQIDLPELGASPSSNGDLAQHMGLLSDVSLDVTIELGRTRMYIEDVLRLNANSIVELDKAAGDPVDIYVNDCHVARGEVLVLNENFCVRISEIVASPRQGRTEEQ